MLRNVKRRLIFGLLFTFRIINSKPVILIYQLNHDYLRSISLREKGNKFSLMNLRKITAFKKG